MTQAIFLSYASQDADAARRICEALRAFGLEVWFDHSELLRQRSDGNDRRFKQASRHRRVALVAN